MKNLKNLGEILNKEEQQSINGGVFEYRCQVGCANKSKGQSCYGSGTAPNCKCPGICSNFSTLGQGGALVCDPN